MRDDAAGIYVHVPFCSAICPYCDFAVVRDREERHEAFVEALIHEIEHCDQATELGTVDTIYFGGGTPSVLGERHLASVLDALDARFEIAEGAQRFFEANPEDVTVDSAAAWRALGFDVLTLGVQALDDDSLHFLGRRHSSADAARAIETAQASSFETVSIDLIYGLPDQTADDWRKTLDRAAAMGTEHLSCYQLTIEPRTPFAREAEQGRLIPPNADGQAEFFFFAHEILETHGFKGYEVSNFARHPKHRSRHNQKYWRHVPYVGFGPSAHAFDGRTRYWNERHVQQWQRRVRASGTGEADRERLSRMDLATEAVMLGLRTRRGIDRDASRTRVGIDPLDGNATRIARWVEEGLIEPFDAPTHRFIVPTLRGMAVADSLSSAWTFDA